MITMDASFIKEETRDGFMVSVARKKVWARELEILSEFDRICRKHDLKYFMQCGTLLGAVRHKGFIPWDDDIDVEMLRPDYERAKEIFKTELQPPLYWQDIYTILEGQDRFDDSVFRLLPFGKIRNADTAAIEEPRAPLSMNQGIYIDIFPVDDARDDIGFTGEMLELQKELYYTVFAENELRRQLESGNAVTVFSKSDLIKIMEQPLVERFRMLENLLISYSGKSTLVNNKYSEINGSVPNFRKEWYENNIELEFEGFSFSASPHFDEMLKGWFGDYMTPVRYDGHSMAVFDADRSYRTYYSDEGIYVGPAIYAQL